MLTLLKWLVGTFLTLAMLLLVAALVLPQVINPNDYRDELVSLVKDQTDRDLSLNGDLKISVFPWLGVETGDLSLSQPSSIKGQMISVDSAQLKVKLMPLLKRQLQIDTVVLKQPDLRIITLADGTSSLSGFESADKGAKQDPEKTNTNSNLTIELQGIEIENGTLVWDNRQAKQYYNLTDFNLETGNLIGHNLENISLSGNLVTEKGSTPIQFKASGLGKINSSTLAANLEDLTATVSLDQQATDIKIGSLNYSENGSVTINSLAAKTQLALDNNETELLPINLTSSELIYGTNNQSVSVGNLKVNGEYKKRPFETNTEKVLLNLDRQTATTKQLNIKSKDLNSQITNLKASKIFDAPAVKADLVFDSFNLKSLLDDLKIDYQASDANALTSLSGKSKVSFNQNSAKLNNLQATLDNSRLSGSVGVVNFEKPELNFQLQLDKLNLDSYLPKEQVATSNADAPKTNSLTVPMQALEDIAANGKLAVGSFSSGGIDLSNIDIIAKTINNKLTITPKANLYDGNLAGNLLFDNSGQQPSLNIKNEIDLVDLAKLLTAADISDQLSGIGSLALDVLVTGDEANQTNQGTIKLQAKNGMIKGVDIHAMLEDAQQLYNTLKNKEQDLSGKSETSDQTVYTDLLGTFYLKDNKLTNDDFKLSSPLFNLTGNGTIDLQSQQIDYTVNIAVNKFVKDSHSKSFAKLQGLVIPVTLHGDLTSPKYKLGTKAIYNALLKQKVKQEEAKYIEKKLGIKDADKLSSKEIIQRALIDRLDKKAKKDNAEQQPEPYHQDGLADPNSTADPVPYDQTGNENSPSPEKTKEQQKESLEDELKRKLLEKIFD